MFIGLTLATKPEEMYRALIEATVYGTKMIIESFIDDGIVICQEFNCSLWRLTTKKSIINASIC